MAHGSRESAASLPTSINALDAVLVLTSSFYLETCSQDEQPGNHESVSIISTKRSVRKTTSRAQHSN